MFPHFLNRDIDAHLVGCDVGYGVEEVEVGKLPVHAVVDYVERFEAVREGVVDCEGALESSRLQRQRCYLGWIMGVVVGVYPCLRTGSRVGCYEEDDVFRP